MGLIALRKSELYYKILNELSKKDQVSETDKKNIEKRVSEMDNEKFLSKEEKKTKKLNPKLKLEDINLDIKAIIKEIKP